MITYFPHYTQVFYQALAGLVEKEGCSTLPKNLLLFGSGPCPEIIGYLDFVRQKFPNMKEDVSVSIFDIGADEWKYSQKITFDHIAPNHSNGTKVKNWNSKKIDFTKPLSAELLGSPRIVAFQNCLNEVKLDQHQTVIENFKKIYEAIPEGSYILITDFSEYDQVITLISSIEKGIEEKGGKKIRSISEGKRKFRSAYCTPPQFVTDNLLTGIAYKIENGLIPRKYVNYNFSILKKEKKEG